MKKHEESQPPQIGPYVFPIILGVMGLWCLYDGWFSTDPDMQEHLTFNRVLSVILLCWSAYDFIKTYRSEKIQQAKCGSEDKQVSYDNQP